MNLSRWTWFTSSVLSVVITGLVDELSWYQGCFSSNSSSFDVQNVQTGTSLYRNLNISLSWNDVIVDCARKCYKDRYMYFSTNVYVPCQCLNESLEALEVEEIYCRSNLTTENNTRNQNFLPISHGEGYTTVYSSEGPYIDLVTLNVDQIWIVVNTAIVLEVTIVIPKLLNITSDLLEITKPLKVSIDKESSLQEDFETRLATDNTCQNISEAWTGNQLYTVVPEKETVVVRIPHVFTSVGEQFLVVRASNGLSTLLSEITVTVQQPEPRDLQVVIQTDEANQPSCIPESFVLPENATYFAIFVNAEFYIEASVANGNNLTFTYVTSDEDGNVVQAIDRPCDMTCDQRNSDDSNVCRDSIKKMRLREEGLYQQTVYVENQHGFLSQTLYLVVMKGKLANLNFTLLSKSMLFVPGMPVIFLVSMEIRSRLNTSLEVQFYKDHTHYATLEDSNTTSLSINCIQEEMSIVASYGLGCVLAIQFEHSFDDEGSYSPVVLVTTYKDVSIKSVLLPSITVMNRLHGATLKSDRIVRVNQKTKITLNLTVSSVNMSVSWAVINVFGVIIENKSSTDPYLVYSFSELGLYYVHCIASNSMGNITARTSIEVEEPIGGHWLTCWEELTVRTDQPINCFSNVTYGSNVEFSWKIFNDDFLVSATISNDNLTSSAVIVFEQRGKYNITVFARNSVSNTVVSLDKLMTVEIPISYVIMLQKEPNILGKTTDLKIITSQSTDIGIQLEFDFGKGRVHYNYSYENSNSAYYLEYLFDEAGIHDVAVYAFNGVSEVTSSVEVIVEHSVDQLEIMMYRAPAVMVPAIFILKTEGHTLERKDLVFLWEFSDGGQTVSASPVISKSFSLAGNHNINFTAKNLVSEYKRSLQVEVVDEIPTSFIVLHDTVVAVNTEIQFTLKGDNSVYHVVQVNYGDGYFQSVERSSLVDGPDLEWTHVYKKCGLYQISLELNGGYDSLAPLQSLILVEEPVTELELTGPSVVEIKVLSLHQEWRAVTKTGTDMMFMWDLDGEILYTTHSKFTRGFDPGTYVLKVTAINDVSQQSADLTIIVQYPIVDLRLSVDPVPLEHYTAINLYVTGGTTFLVDINYGDNTSEIFSSDDRMLKVKILDRSDQGLPRYQVTIEHRYQSIDSYVVAANVSNLVSCKVESNIGKVHEPIGGIEVTTDSQEVIPLGEKVKVTASVSSGKNLQFEWKFSDKYYRKPTVVSMGNTSTAIHEFELAGDYDVSVKVTNDLYQEPFIAKLPFKFKVVEEIVDLTLMEVNNRKKALLIGTKPDQKTEPITFRAICHRGSHVTFLFNFGDENSETVEIPSVTNNFYWMSGETSHRYTQEGVYSVYVTAVNPLGNVTSFLKESFSVERPPHKPKLRSSYHIEYGQNFTFKVDQIDDANVTFDWKFGDNTDVVNSNKSEMSHFYQKAKVYDLVVIAKDRGTKTSTKAKVYVEHRIQGVTLNVSSTILDASEDVRLSANVLPGYDNLVTFYRWKLGTDLPIRTEIPYVQQKLKAGRYTVTVSAHNNVSSSTSPAVVLHLLSKIESLELNMMGNPIVNNVLIFKATFYRGSEIRFKWNFGDGSPVVMNDSSQYVKHNFTKEGVYNVVLTASNLISHASRTKRLFILYRICIPPEISIYDKSIKKVNRSLGLQYEVEVKPTICENNLMATEYQWTLSNSSTNQLVDIPNVDKKSLQQKRLVLKPCTLTVGFYKLEVKVQIKDTIVYSIETMEIEVLPSPLNVVIKGGVVRETTRQEKIVLDGSLSGDPDCTDNVDIRYNWTCSASFGSSESCFIDNVTDVLTFDLAEVSMPTSVILPSLDEIIVTLTVWKDNKSPQSTLQVIRISDRPKSLKLNIYCPQCDKKIINANERLLLQAVCTNCPEDVIQYDWTTLFVSKSGKSQPVQEQILCAIKLVVGSKFNRLRQASDTDTRNMYKSDTGDEADVKRGNNPVIHSSLFKDLRRKKRGMSFKISNSSLPMFPMDKGNTFDSMMPLGMPRIAENTVNWRRQRQKGSRESSRHRHYSHNDSFHSTRPYFGNDMFEVKKETPIQGNSPPTREKTNSRVNPGVNPGMKDTIYNEQKKQVRQKHILEKSSIAHFFRDDQTTTGTHKQSLVIKPDYFKEGFEYIIKVQARFKDGSVGGTAMTTFTVNSSPSKGVCEISRNSGVELTTQFRLYCHEWKDEDKPLQYEVTFTYHEDGIRYVIYRGLRQGVNFTLPAGDKSEKYKVMLYISVLDDLLAKTSVCSYPLEVRPFSLEPGQHLEDIVLNHTDLSNPLGRLTQVKDQGDDHQVKGVILSLGRCLQRVVTDDGTDYDRRTLRKSIDNMLEELGHLSMRDEVEVLQTVQALESLVTLTKEFDMSSLEASVNIVKIIDEKVREFKSLVINEDLYMLLHTITSSLIKSLAEHQQQKFRKQQIMYREYLEKMIQVHNSLLQKEMTYHINGEEELTKTSSFITTKAVRYSFNERPVMEINQSKIILPEKMELILKKKDFDRLNDDIFMPNQNCFQVHMTKYNFNPYSYDRMQINKIQSEVCSLNVLTCNGTPVDVKNLDENNLVQIEVPRIEHENEVIGYHQLQKSVMNIHYFNVTYSDRNNSLNIEIDLVPVSEGRLFPIAVLINYNVPPTPNQFITRQEVQGDHLQIFLPSRYLNHTGEYFIGLLDAGLNKGRPRQGEVTQRNYTLKLWWNKCLFWNETTRYWSDNGCWATDKSTYFKTHCLCNHLTAFGSHFELIANDLSHISVEDFFDLNENPVTVCLTGAILLFYVLLMILCHKLDTHDARKGGITYLIDNNLTDKQKYEVTIETGFRKGAGTTAKISVILHGEEGLSETRELISDDDCPLFERNSRDKFIMTSCLLSELTTSQLIAITTRSDTGSHNRLDLIQSLVPTHYVCNGLPDSIGKIWKVQLWHNNFGASPSWYLSRVIVKDLNSGSTYYFISEKWLAVEEDDGKVEREFMALEGNLGFRKVFWAKGTQYLSDYHIWMSLLTCPSYSQFNRKQRLTCCLTLLMIYMCLNAMWYKEIKPEYRGEFGLLDVSLRSITVGAICSAVVIPVNLLIMLLFRRSKMERSGNQNEPIVDEEKDEEFASGKPNEHVQEEEEVESVQPIMTYSILDQSILNWPSIQDWAQKQWVKRHQGYQETSNSPEIPHMPNQIVQRRILGSEIDQASSGFEDSNSTDPRRQVTISSQNSSQKIKAPSISSGTIHRASNCSSRKMIGTRLFLPYWCQFIAWFLCTVIVSTCAVITIMYGFRFGISKSIMWIQSLYFSFMVCVFITQPFMIIIAVIYTAIRYKNDPSILDHYEDGEFGEKAKLEILRRKKEQIQYTEQEELERGVAARQRSRYLRFARPPQEKQLIEARKKIMKEKKAMSLLRDTSVMSLMFILLCVMAYGKDTSSPYYINEALKNSLIRSGPVIFNSIKYGNEWYNWSQTTLLDGLYPTDNSHTRPNTKQAYQPLDNSLIIGQVQIRQLRVTKEDCYCPYDLPFLPDDCLHDYQSSNQMKGEKGDNLTIFKEATSSFNIIGKHGIYDDSGFVLKLNKTRLEVSTQLLTLQNSKWINNQTRAVIVEFTLYNAPTNLFTSVVILLEIPSSGGAYPNQRIRSTHLYRYVTQWDNLVLAFELMFIILTVYKIGVQLCDAVKVEKYFHNFWVVIDTMFSVLSLMYIIFYVYRFILVSETVESLRSTYFSQFVDVSFLTFWDEIIRCLVGMILFLVMIKYIRLLHYNKVFSLFGTVYRRLQREIITFMGLFIGSIIIFSRIGHVLFGAFLDSFSDAISSIFTVSALLTGIYEDYPMPDSSLLHTMRIFILFFSVFATGLLTSYIIAVLSYRFKMQKHKHSVFLVMKPRETIMFYWQTFLLWTGIHSAPVDEEPDNVLPPEFTMAEVEYQVDELFFRINTLTGSHGLPEKPTSYFTDSDGTYGLGDDGISSGGSEVNLEDDDRLENRVHKIEDSLCSHEPYLAQLLKLNQTDGMTKGREKQIRSHLEMEIFRQLQNQRNTVPGKVTGDSSKSSATTSGSNSEMTTPFGDRKSGEPVKKPVTGVSTIQQHTFVHHAEVSLLSDTKTSPYQARRSTASSSSNPDSPDEIVKNIERVRLLKEKGGKKISSKPEDNTSQSGDMSKNQQPKVIKKPEPPHKPTFHNPGIRDVQAQDTNKSSVLNSPALRQLRSSLQAIERDRHSFKGESGSSVATESSSGSEQDAIHGKACVQAQLKRNLRKTKSRGKGKGSVNLTSVLLDDLDPSNDELGATGNSFKISETEPILEQESVEDYFD